jgi:hypothetical protein
MRLPSEIETLSLRLVELTKQLTGPDGQEPNRPPDPEAALPRQFQHISLEEIARGQVRDAVRMNIPLSWRIIAGC